MNEICKFYELHGIRKTREKWPNRHVKSIIDNERKKGWKPNRQSRWTIEEKILASQMNGIISYEKQAKVLGRPTNSIRSYWERSGNTRFVNGLYLKLAQHFANPGLEKFSIKTSNSRRIVPWTDLSRNLRTDLPAAIKEAIEAMAKFQVWLHQTTRVRSKIKKWTSGSIPKKLSKL